MAEAGLSETRPAPAVGGSAPAPQAWLPRRLLVALDASDHAERALAEAVRLAGLAGGEVAGIHVYAAKLHDRRFRQMEGGLPERYRVEPEMERQREVHDDLITRGLGVISDSYHDAAEARCVKAGLAYERLSPEGKNYRPIVDAASSGAHDLLVLGALGLGAVAEARIGTVCARVVRRSPIDVLVVRDPARGLADGPLVVAIDGSPRAYGALKVALALSARLGVPVHAVAVYDPYFHYVAFKRISGVLSDEAGQVFRFKEQERLHEEIIDDGLAKIYRSHLDVAKAIAAEDGVELACRLLDGKPYPQIARYAAEIGASTVLAGRTGIHADDGLDIGGNAENLLLTAPCHLWLGAASYAPPLEALARETISWTEEAEGRMSRVPETARKMVRMAIVRFAQERGHTVVTSRLVDEATRRFCPHFGGAAEAEKPPQWSAETEALLGEVGDATLQAAIRLRAEKRARRAGAAQVGPEHLRPLLEAQTGVADGDGAQGCPFSGLREAVNGGVEAPESAALEWTADAEERLERVPAGVMRALTRRRIEAFARRRGAETVTAALIDEKYEEWAAGSAKQAMSLAWDDAALARVNRIPAFVRGMVVLELERYARDVGSDRVTEKIIERANGIWARSGRFHTETTPGLHGEPRERRDH